MHTRFLLALAALLALGAFTNAAAQSPLGPFARAEERGFPMVALDTYSELGVRYASDPAQVEALEGLAEVRLLGVVVPTPSGLESVDLDLRRVDPVAEGALLFVDGEVAGGEAALRAGASLWSGSVAGEPESDVYLAFTDTGSRGWISRPEGRSHLLALPEDGADWRNTTSALVHQDDPVIRQSAPTWTCETETSPVLPGGAMLPEHDPEEILPGGSAGTTEGATIECKIAIETDWQFYQLFNDETAATNYVTSLWGAVSSRFEDATNVFITLPHLSIYTTSNDPWTVPDNNGSSSAMLTQFRNYWNNQGGFPNGANLAHFMSGANLGGGVAYGNTLCTANGVAVSGNLHGQTPIPVPTKSSLSWDFVVTSHETGHSFGAAHTHDYCPPIDECYPGNCTSGGMCISNGTIMSYCHLCPGGMLNVQTFFHQRVANTMSKIVQFSCLCTSCPCNPPKITGISPPNVVSYDPDGQTVTLTGKRMSDVHTVYVDGQILAPSQFEVLAFDKMELEMPTVSRTGDVDIQIEDDCGPSAAALVHVDPPAAPVLGPDDPLQSASAGATITVAGDPGDTVYVLWSPDLAATVVPGFLSLDIGANFTSLYVLWNSTMPSKAWESRTFPLSGVPVNTVFYVQAAILPPSGFPFVTTDYETYFVWF